MAGQDHHIHNGRNEGSPGREEGRPRGPRPHTQPEGHSALHMVGKGCLLRSPLLPSCSASCWAVSTRVSAAQGHRVHHLLQLAPQPLPPGLLVFLQSHQDLQGRGWGLGVRGQSWLPRSVAINSQGGIVTATMYHRELHRHPLYLDCAQQGL